MDIQKIHSISEYIQIICSENDTLTRNGADKNETLLFRGQSSSTYELLPSLGRGRRTACQISIFDEERNMIEMAKYKLPDVFHSNLSPIELLALLQHHGIPTRLLDVTENALVALYFACNENENQDGEVFLFKNNELDITNYPFVNAIADSYRFAMGSWSDLKTFYSKVISQPYFIEQKQTLKSLYTNEEGAAWIEECCEIPLFVYAPIRSLRQQVQRGRYILFPNRINNDKRYFEKIIDPMPKDHDVIASVISIPKDKKKQLIKELKLFGISEETLFCDNIDIVCKNIKETYQNKVGGASCLT